MNLHAIVTPAISAVNPPIVGTLYVSTGASKGADYSRTPTWLAAPDTSFQVQALTAKDIEHLDSLNIQGVTRAVYMNGNVEGLDRPAGKGGDVLLFANRYWLVKAVLETWDTAGWCKVALALQNGKPDGID
jgi:hypothetical protein